VRLLIVAGATTAISPLLADEVLSRIAGLTASELIRLIASETIVGSSIGLMGRFFLLSLQFAMTTVANMIGLSGIPGVAVEEAETGSALATLCSTTAVMIILSMGLHIEMLRAVLDSYQVFQIGTVIDLEGFADAMTSVLSQTSVLALRISAPFILYGVITNAAIGLANRFAPHISVYHVSSGGVMLGGLLLLNVLWENWLMIFLESYEAWLRQGGF
jgi:flagellar biosynthesis protein FliR